MGPVPYRFACRANPLHFRDRTMAKEQVKIEVFMAEYLSDYLIKEGAKVITPVMVVKAFEAYDTDIVGVDESKGDDVKE